MHCLLSSRRRCLVSIENCLPRSTTRSSTIGTAYPSSSPLSSASTRNHLLAFLSSVSLSLWEMLISKLNMHSYFCSVDDYCCRYAHKYQEKEKMEHRY
ncbi:hypothetical protein LINGRAHAP2_LOCUS9620 [Linum grandiflorum]